MNYFDPSLMAARSVDQSIADGRRFDNPGWQVSGFELIQHSSAVTDWSDEASSLRSTTRRLLRSLGS